MAANSPFLCNRVSAERFVDVSTTQLNTLNGADGFNSSPFHITPTVQVNSSGAFAMPRMQVMEFKFPTFIQQGLAASFNTPVLSYQLGTSGPGVNTTAASVGAAHPGLSPFTEGNGGSAANAQLLAGTPPEYMSVRVGDGYYGWPLFSHPHD